LLDRCNCNLDTLMRKDKRVSQLAWHPSLGVMNYCRIFWWARCNKERIGFAQIWKPWLLLSASAVCGWALLSSRIIQGAQSLSRSLSVFH
jgi:hypothetical protein